MLDRNAIDQLLSLRLLIARAAQKDSLSWWEDESLTQAGNFLMERLFIMDTTESARKLAIEAAKTRYRMAFGENGPKLHLFQLDQRGQVEYELEDVRYSEIEIPVEPIASLDTLRQELLAITGTPMPYEIVGPGINNQLEIRMKDISRKTPVLELAKTLAWACLESLPGKPVFPYIQWTQ
jgi:hypothetical protein